ncbi:hypothetical protein NY08_694 [Rhodococcus sp. B7740]|nr:hypothetical protein NY08_694 [Rhodococcus sp. B7740]
MRHGVRFEPSESPAVSLTAAPIFYVLTSADSDFSKVFRP